MAEFNILKIRTFSNLTLIWKKIKILTHRHTNSRKWAHFIVGKLIFLFIEFQQNIFQKLTDALSYCIVMNNPWLVIFSFHLAYATSWFSTLRPFWKWYFGRSYSQTMTIIRPARKNIKVELKKLLGFRGGPHSMLWRFPGQLCGICYRH